MRGRPPVDSTLVIAIASQVNRRSGFQLRSAEDEQFSLSAVNPIAVQGHAISTHLHPSRFMALSLDFTSISNLTFTFFFRTHVMSLHFRWSIF
jgi:hypothetical protein